MAAGVPLVVSDWNGYRDLIRDGIDGFGLRPDGRLWQSKHLSPWVGSSCWALEPFPKVAGALGQLVQVDTHAAEAACLTLLTRSELRRAMGAAARQRAFDTFHPTWSCPRLRRCFRISRTDANSRCFRRLSSQSPAGSGAHVCLLCHHGRFGSLPERNKTLRHFPLSPLRFVRSGVRCGMFCGILCPSNDTMSFGLNLLRKHNHPAD